MHKLVTFILPVTASKASTGNLEVMLNPCAVNVLLSKTVGEYEEKLKQQDFELVMNVPNHPVNIMADDYGVCWIIY